MGRVINDVTLQFRSTKKPVRSRPKPGSLKTDTFKRPAGLGDIVSYQGKDFVVLRASIHSDGYAAYDLIREGEYIGGVKVDQTSDIQEKASNKSMNYAFNCLVDKESDDDGYTDGPF